LFENDPAAKVREVLEGGDTFIRPLEDPGRCDTLKESVFLLYLFKRTGEAI